FFFAAGFYNTVRGTNNIPQIKKTEVTIMALSNLFGWAQKNGEAAASACGSACGAGDKPEEKPAACGSACGAGDKPEEKPAACGSACGAGDK
ncbi:MAG: ACGX-repeat peptide, partial [Ruthenibacterium lactatiformans]